ncbi:hypothetical protein F4818DRAFT_440622 [Hypoxylon cercidicola]|nr:hypothetical protein F4818DRAFT_440622 [Hypoxylon cercidicola]
MGKDQPGLEVSSHDAPEAYIEPPQLFYVENHGPSNFPRPLDTETINPPQQTSPSLDNFRTREKTICGLRAGHFWAITVIATLTVVVAVVGGSVGGILAARSSGSGTLKIASNEAIASPTTSSTPATPFSSTPASTARTSSSITTLISSPTPFPTAGLLALDCPSIDTTSNSTIASGTRYTFVYHCGNDLPGDDIQMGNSTDIEGCVAQCAEHNADAGSTGCHGVVWNGNLTSAIRRGGNCYLKSGDTPLSPCGDSCPLAAAAVLVGTASTGG